MTLGLADQEPTHGEGPLRPRPRWSLIALAMPFVAFFGGCAVGGAYGGHPVSVAIVAVRGYGVLSLAGICCGGIALYRRERLWGLTVAGLVVNGLGALGLVAFLESPWNPPRWFE
jgi:O-antigen ligase